MVREGGGGDDDDDDDDVKVEREDVPVASCTRASFKGFLRRCAIVAESRG